MKDVTNKMAIFNQGLEEKVNNKVVWDLNKELEEQVNNKELEEQVNNKVV